MIKYIVVVAEGDYKNWENEKKNEKGKKKKHNKMEKEERPCKNRTRT